MNIRVHGLRLAKRLAANDQTQNCPFCNKTEWGEEYHQGHCPFFIAYAIIEFEKNNPLPSVKTKLK
jgi:hypothetical protein